MPKIFMSDLYPEPEISRYNVMPWELTQESGLFRYPRRWMTIDEMLAFNYLEDISEYIIKTQLSFFTRGGIHAFALEFTKNRRVHLCMFREQVPGLGKVTSVYNACTRELIAQRIERI